MLLNQLALISWLKAGLAMATLLLVAPHRCLSGKSPTVSTWWRSLELCTELLQCGERVIPQRNRRISNDINKYSTKQLVGLQSEEINRLNLNRFNSIVYIFGYTSKQNPYFYKWKLMKSGSSRRIRRQAAARMSSSGGRNEQEFGQQNVHISVLSCFRVCYHVL